MDERYLNRLRNNIRKFYLFKTFSNFGFMLPVIVLFWQDNGLSMTKIMLLQSLFALCVVGLEVPTGYLADVWGRKRTLMGAGVFFTLGYALYSVSSSFWQFAAAEVLFALAISLISGSDSAFLYDTLKELGEESRFQQVWGKSLFYNMLFISFSNVVGGLIGKVDFRIPLYVSVPVAASILFIAKTMQEPKRHKLIVKEGYGRELLRIVRFALVENTKLRWLIVYAGVIFAFNQAALWFYQPYFSLSGMDIAYFGVVFASFQVVAAFSSKYAYRIERLLGQKTSLAVLVFIVGVSFLLMGNFVFLFSFSFAFLQQFTRGFFRVVVTDYVNKLASSDVRATIISVQNMFASLLYAIVIPFAGWAADALSLVQALFFVGLAALLFGGSVLFVLHHKKVV